MSAHVASDFDPVSVIEAAYALERPLDAWLQGILDVVAPALDFGRGVFVTLYDATDARRLVVSHARAHRMSEVRMRLIEKGASTAGREVVEALRSVPCGTMSDKLGRERLRTVPLLAAARFLFGTRDLVGVNATDPSLQGVAFCAPSTRAVTLTPAFELRWTRVAGHIASAWRLRRQVHAATSRDPDVEAVLEPGGRLVHAEPGVESRAQREALRGAVVAMERARTARRRRDEGLSAWKVLVDGRWALVDSFERDGKRFVLARRNEPGGAAQGLSTREAQVAAFACLGHSNKLIAYELGITTTTVATYLASALQRLGVGSRVELIRRFRLGELDFGAGAGLSPARRPPAGR